MELLSTRPLAASGRPGDNGVDAPGSGGSMTNRRLAWGVAALAPVFLLAAVAIALSAGNSLATALDDVTGVGFVFSVGFPVLGALVVRQRGSHAVGWLMIAIGVSIAFHTAVLEWAESALLDDPGSLPGGDLASWIGVWAWLPGWALATTLLPVLFPDGRVVGRRRLLAWIDSLAVAVITGAIAGIAWQFRGPRLVDGSGSGEHTPASFEHVATVGFALLGVLTFVSMGSLLIRHRRATADLRRQIGWAVYGAVIAVLMSFVGSFVDIGGLFQVLEAGALVGGLAVAMLRYRLYDIEVVVNRTLVYGALTATLAGVYLVSVLLIQLVLSPSSSIAIAASTLGVAALFRPAQAAIQATVDRRFYRRRYDAARTLAQFGARLRDQVDLRALDTELRAIVRETLQPAHVSLWLRQPEARR
jgi:hypothetical protein